MYNLFVPKDNFNKGLVYLALSALIYSAMPVLIRQLDAGNIPPISQVFLRYIIAFLCALIYFNFSREKFPVLKKTFLLASVGVFGYGLTNLLFTFGVIYTNISNALFIFYCYAIITPVLAFFVLKENLNKFHIVSIVTMLVALTLLFQPTSIDTWKIGALFAFASALTQSFYLVGRRLLNDYSSAFILLASTFLGAISMGILALAIESNFYFLSGGINKLSAETWLVTLIFGVGNFGAWFSMSQGFQLIKATTASLIMLVELLFSTLFALIVFSEVPTIMTIIGGLLILIGAVIVILKGE